MHPTDLLLFNSSLLTCAGGIAVFSLKLSASFLPALCPRVFLLLAVQAFLPLFLIRARTAAMSESVLQ